MGSFASSLAGAASTSSSSAHPAGSFVPEYEDVQAALRLLTDGLNLPPELALLTLDLAEYHPVLRATSNIPRSQPVVVRAGPRGQRVGKVLCVSEPIPAWEGAPVECVKRVTAETESRDQGFSSFPAKHGTRSGSSSWFEAVLLRPEAPSPPAVPGATSSTGAASPSPSRSPPSLPGSFPSPATSTSPSPTSDPARQTHRPILTARLHSNLHASRQFSTFTLSFIAAPPPPSTSSDPSAPFDDPAEVEGDDHDAPQHVVDRAELVRQARAGDRIAVVARAEYPAWVNAVAACEVRVQVRAV